MPAKFRHHFANLSTFAPLSNLLLSGLRSAISPSSSIGLFLLSDVDELLPSSARRRTTQSKMDKLTSNDRIVQTSFPKSKTLYSNQPKIFNMIDLLNIGGQLHGRSAITFRYLNKRHTFFFFNSVRTRGLPSPMLDSFSYSFKLFALCLVYVKCTWSIHVSALAGPIDVFKWNGISISYLNIITYGVKIWLHIRKFVSLLDIAV